jgi:hypothetical protein
VAGVLLLPKCLACVAGYVALATGFAATPELCGAITTPSAFPVFASWLIGPACLVLIVIGKACFRRLSGTGPAVR